MRILVPCDFSKSSNNAALYAAKFAKKVDAEIILFNVVHFESPPMVQIGKQKMEELIFPQASRECNDLASKLKSTVKGIRISFKVVTGFPIESLIEDYAVSNKIDLIVMGTKGASGLQKTLFGSNAVNVINRSSIPVITVPEYARFSSLKHIVYASDTLKIHSGLQKLILLVQHFNASIDIFHTLPQDYDKKVDVVEIKDNLVDKYKYKKLSFHVSYNDDVIEAINDFVADNRADLLVMFTHNITFFENLFNTSFSRKMAFHSLIPLLTIKK